MVTPVKLGLAQILRKVHSVKNCTLTSSGALSANLWSGSAVHVYDLEQPIKARQIRKILQETTRLGIGTLFILAHPLAPPDGERCEPAEWLTAIHELSGDRLYTYRLQESRLLLGQIHMKPYGGNLREIWHGPDIVPAALPFYRMWVRTPAIRGDWLVGNFGNELFWKQPGFRIDRDVDSQRYDGQRVKGWTSEQVFSAYTDKAMPLMQEAKLELAYRQLGIPLEASEDDVKAAFRRLARECHPDVSRLPKDEAERRFHTINEAYAYIRQRRGW